MKVDFYVFDAAGKLPALRYACGLIERAYTAKEPVYVHAASKAEAEHFDTLLWTFKDDSFIPHQLFDSENPAPVEIGYQTAPLHSTGLLVNLNPAFPDFYAQYGRIIEIVFSDPTMQQLARERFRQYREKGCELTTHKINVNEQIEQ